MTKEETKAKIQEALQAFTKGNLTQNSLDLFGKLGYTTDRRASLDKPDFEEFKDTFITNKRFDEAKARAQEWNYVDLLFQLSKEELTQQVSLFDTKQVDKTIIETYLFFAIELTKEEYNRTDLSNITREINRLFPMPVMVLFKYGNKLTFSIINRRLHKRDESKDVLEKVTLIKDISIENPIRAHIEILFDLSFQELHNKHLFTNFVELHNAWQKTLDTKELNKRFYSELFNWYLWAVQSVRFPNDVNDDKDDNVYNAESVIRLITRLIFVWFIKEKNLVPETLFNIRKLKTILKDFQPESEKTSVYYRAILQNLFFATLNTPMDKDITEENKDEKRRFINTLPKIYNDQYLDQTKYRYQDYFTNPDKALELFSSIPFLNGGLFECLDFKEGNKEIRFDGFSSTGKRQAFVPDKLFFVDEFILDLNAEYGTKGKKYKVEGLINILDSYKFTITENTPLEEEIALDPELLGKVFENLLASYNPETKSTARKQTGSFYTPREIVNYMVDESLIAYFQSALSIPQSTLSIPAQGNKEQSIPAQGNKEQSIPAQGNKEQSIPAQGKSSDDFGPFFNPNEEIDIHQGNYPHWQQKDVWYFITFRLADSIPAEVVEKIKQERVLWLKSHPDLTNLTKEERIEYHRLFSERVENLLNAGRGSCVLKDPVIAKIVSDALLHFNNERYSLDEWVIMPNHVHILVRPFEGFGLPEITHSWKSFTANEINKATGNKGQLWMHESYDHIVRNEHALQAIRNYIRQNPVKAKLKEGTFILSDRSKDDSPGSIPVTDLMNRSRDASGTLDASETLETRLRDLFAHTTELPEFSEAEHTAIIKAISEVKILDPACGSGAFPMGVLHRLVDLLNKLDPENKHWIELQKQRAIAETAEVFENGDVTEREIRLNEINKAFDININYPDYARKLFLIENCIYGVDIQQIAIQISKLRFFISLIVDQKVNDARPNRNILSMPNLETKFVAANTLIGLEQSPLQTLPSRNVQKLEKELSSIRHKIFFTRKYSAKKALKTQENKKREELKSALLDSGFQEATATQVAGWNPFDPMQSAKFFDPETMFGFEGGFDVVIGNPPYVVDKNLSQIEKKYFANNYKSALYQLNLYLLFIEKALTISSKFGTTSFIVPNTWLINKTVAGFRKYFIENFIIKSISDLTKGDVFEATVLPVIFTASNQKPLNPYKIIIYEYQDRIFNYKLATNSTDILSDKDFLINYQLPSKNQNLLNKLEIKSIPLSKIALVSFGVKFYQVNKGTPKQTRDIVDNHSFTHNSKINKQCKRILEGKDIDRYSYTFRGNWIEYGEWLAEPRKPELFEGERILLRRIVGKGYLISTFIDDNYCNNSLLHTVKPNSKDFNTKFVLAILNSKLMGRYFIMRYARDEKTFPEIRVHELESLPMKKSSNQQPFITIVDQILTAKKANPKADTLALEKQIDELVYQLYNLTEDEIAIIENSMNKK